MSVSLLQTIVVFLGQFVSLFIHADLLYILSATYGFMDGDDAFSAALILVVVNIAFPRSPREEEAMNQALEVLRGMADRGNSHIRARRQSLLKLQTMMEKMPSSSPVTTTTTPAVETATRQEIPLEDTGCSGGEIEGGMAETLPSVDSTATLNQPFLDAGGLIEDTSLWEEIYGNMDLWMDFDWSEAARIASPTKL